MIINGIDWAYFTFSGNTAYSSLCIFFPLPHTYSFSFHLSPVTFFSPRFLQHESYFPLMGSLEESDQNFSMVLVSFDLLLLEQQGSGLKN